MGPHLTPQAAPKGAEMGTSAEVEQGEKDKRRGGGKAIAEELVEQLAAAHRRVVRLEGLVERLVRALASEHAAAYCVQVSMALRRSAGPYPDALKYGGNANVDLYHAAEAAMLARLWGEANGVVDA